jgi:hypothetical protein
MADASLFDWAGVAALLGVLGGGARWLAASWFGRADKREADVTMRESLYREKIEKRLATVEERADRIERAYGVVVGICHVWLEEIPHNSPSLPAIAAQLKVVFPLPEEMPADLLNLVARLEGKKSRGAAG